MEIIFDASVLNLEFTGVGKTLLFLYKSCYELNCDFHAIGFGCYKHKRDTFSDYGIELLESNEIESCIMNKDIQVIHYPFNKGVKKRIRNIPQILTIHDLIPYEEKYYNIYRRAQYIYETRLSIKRSDRIITVSEYSKSSIIRFTHGAVTPVVIPWGVTLPTVSEEKTEKPKELSDPYFLYVGGYAGRKGIDCLVKAFSVLNSRGLTKCKLVLTGQQRPLDSVTDNMIREGVENGTIIQTGYVTDEQICNYYKNAVCSLYLSKAEGFGLPIIESMQCGCPIITTKYTSLPEIGGNAACYVDREDINSVIGAMLKMENDIEFRNNHIVAGYKNVERYNWQDSASKFLTLIKEVNDR